MTGNINSRLISTGVLTLLLLASSLMGSCSSAPMEDSTPVLVEDDIVVYYGIALAGLQSHLVYNVRKSYYNIMLAFKDVKKTLKPLWELYHPSFILLQLENTTYDRLVCPLYKMYSSIQEALQRPSTDNQWRHNMTVLSFITETQTQAVCIRVS